MKPREPSATSRSADEQQRPGPVPPTARPASQKPTTMPAGKEATRSPIVAGPGARGVSDRGRHRDDDAVPRGVERAERKQKR